MTGKPYAMRMVTGLRRPKNPVSGRDVAGTVVKVGSAVTRFVPGDEVYGIAPGSFAEYAVGPEKKLALKPASLTFAEAAVVPISAGTALQALRDVGRVQPGQTVLIIGASGGVGSYAVQLAKVLGAKATAVASAAKADFVRGLGADHVLDYNRDDFADGTKTYDLILDIGGGSSLKRLRRALNPRGTVVFVGSENTGNITGMGRLAARRDAVPLRAGAPRPADGEGTRQRPQPAHRSHRGRSGDPHGCRQLPPCSYQGRDAAAAGGQGSRQGRHLDGDRGD